MRLIEYLALTLVSTSTLSVAAQGASPLLNDEADSFINQVLTSWGTPGGFSVSVVRKDAQGNWQTEVKGYGNARVDGTKFTEKTFFGIGSNSKLFNVLSTGLLIHNETLSPRLTWNTKLSDVIPGFDLQDPVAAKEATIIDAMSHRTGLPRHDLAPKANDNVPALIRKMKYFRPSASFRDVWQYNNNVYTMLSYLPTAVLPSKIPFARFVKEHIFDPLGLNSTTYSSIYANSTGLLADGIVFQPASDNNTVVPVAVPLWSVTDEDGSLWSGAGGIISNGDDLATWLKCLLLDGRNPKTNATVIPEDVLQTVATGYSIERGYSPYPELSPVVYGGGQERGSYRGYEYVEHAGDTVGFHSVISRFPDEGLGIAVGTNDNNYGPLLVQIVKWWLADQAFGLEKVDWNSRYKAQAAAKASVRPTPRPSNATFSYGDLSSISGIYDNPGYGESEFCLVTSNQTSASQSCRQLAANPAIKALVNPSVPTFVVKWGHSFISHLVMSHFNGPIFNVSAYDVIATGNPSIPLFPIPVLSGALAEVDRNFNGIAFTGDFWGAGDGVADPKGNTVQERADVWFSRVK